MRKLLSITLAVIAISTFAFAQEGFRIKTRSAAELFAAQRRVIGEWCRQDYLGARLLPDGWERLKPLSTFRQNPDFHSIVIVSRYQVPPREESSWDVDVTYWILGRYDRGLGYTPANNTEVVTFKTKDIDGDIVINEIDPGAPHVSKRAAIDWMKRQLEAADTSDVDKVYLRRALTTLETPEAQPSSK